MDEGDRTERNLIICPLCEKDDKIEKVTAIVKYQIREYEDSNPVWDEDGSMSYVSNYGVQKSNLAIALSLPIEPEEPTRSGSCIIMILLVLGSIWLGIGCSVIFFVSVLGRSIVEGGFKEPITEMETGGIANVIMGAIVIGITAIIYIASSRKLKKDKVQFEEIHDEWMKSKAIWERLYYCYRNDKVFDPGTEKYDDPDNMMRLIDEIG